MGVYITPGSEREPGQQNPESLFGPRMIGEDKAKAYLEQRENGSNIFGPRITGVGETKPVEPSKILDGVSFSINALSAIVGEFPEKLDDLLKAETLRPEGPRKGAIRALHAAEMRREDGGRPDVLAQLTGMLK